MLLNLREYLRPASLTEAVALLSRAEIRTAPLAGGTELAGRMDDQLEAVVDLSPLGLNRLETGPRSLRLGAMVTLKQLVTDPAVTQLASGLLARAAAQAAPATIRAAATLGGTLAGEKGGLEIPTALLALDARVTLAGAAPLELPLAAFFAQRDRLLNGTLIVSVTIPTPSALRGAFHFVSRSPADRAILCAAAVTGAEAGAGTGGGAPPVRVALGGYLEQPVLLSSPDALPPGQPVTDFRASAEYRGWVAPVLARRAAAEAMGGESA